MVLSDEDKILTKISYLKGYTGKRLTGEFPDKSWTKHGVNKLRDIGAVDRLPGNSRPHSARTEKKAKLLLSEVPAVCN